MMKRQGVAQMAELRRSAKGTTRRLGRPPASIGAETRDRIIDTARRHFAARGYSAATNSDVAHEAGITTGAIYHYFRSKKELYWTVFEDAQTTIYDRFTAAVDGVEGCIPKLHAVLDGAMALERGDPSLADFIVSVSTEARRHPELADLYVRQDQHQRAFFLPIVEEGVRSGEFGPGVKAADVLEMLLAVLGGMARYAAVTHNVDRHRAAVLSFQRLLDGVLLSDAAPVVATGKSREGRRTAGPDRSARDDTTASRPSGKARKSRVG
jgi:AcrR family transcriptional regulator